MLLQTSTQTSYRKWHEQYSLVSAFIAGFAIPTSTALLNLGALLLLIAFLTNKEFIKNLSTTIKNPFSIFGILLLILMSIATLWSTAPTEEIVHGLTKMRAFYLIPVFLAVFLDQKNAAGLLYGFMIGVFISLLLSFSMYFGDFYAFKAYENNWSVFYAQGYPAYFLSIFSIILLAGVLTKSFSRFTSIVAIILIFLSVFNVLFLTISRTGQISIILMILVVLFFYNKKISFLAGIPLLLLSIFILPIYSSNISERFAIAFTEVQEFEKGNYVSNTGLRLEYQKNTLNLIKESPIFGHGTGSFVTEYTKRLSEDEEMHLQQPHNDYLFVTAQIGISGIVILFGLMLSAIMQSRKKPESIKLIIYSIISFMFIGTLANSLFTDNVSGAAFVLLMTALLSVNTLPWSKKC